MHFARAIAFALPFALAAPASAAHLGLTYDIRFAGLPAARVTVEGDVDAKTYAFSAETHTLGLTDVLVHFKSNAQSRGTITGQGPEPAAHDAINRWRGKDRHVHLLYGAEKIAVDVAPDAAHDKRDPVPEDARAGTVDPITAALRLMLAAGTSAPCGGTVHVFDGRRRYDISTRDGGLKPLSSGPAQARGEARVCEVSYIDLGGRSRDSFWPRSKEPKKAELWFRPLDLGIPPFAVLATSSAGLLPITIRLTRLEVDGRAVIATAASGKGAEASQN